MQRRLFAASLGLLMLISYQPYPVAHSAAATPRSVATDAATTRTGSGSSSTIPTRHYTLRSRAAARAAAKRKRLQRAQARSSASSSTSSSASSVPPTHTGATMRSLRDTRASRLLLGQFRDEVLRLTNVERAQAELTPLRMNLVLQDVAQAHANDMQERNYFAHESPDGVTVEKRIRASTYLQPPCACSWSYLFGENIAAGYTTPESVVQAWMESPGHRENILRPEYREIGIGITGTLWVQEFGGIHVK